MKWEYRRKAVAASSIINAQEQGARELGHSSIPKYFVKGPKEKTKLETTSLFFYFFVERNNIFVQRNLNMDLKSKT